ncbi:MAG: tetratricopeptide repeat protein [Flavobacterium sp.]|nr:tetratricopeptide repeat protein [Flavobacterium sp.]
MRNTFGVAVAALLISSASFAQKDELKTLKKLYGRDKLSDKDMTEYKSTVAKAESFLSSANEDDRTYINFYKSMAPILELQRKMTGDPAQNTAAIAQELTPAKINELAASLNSVLEYEKKTGKKVYTKDIEETVKSFSPLLLNYAIQLGSNKRGAEASSLLYSLYTLDKTNQDNLYYAASYAVNSNDYDTALKYYDELKALKYSGETTLYYAQNVASGKEESFPTKADRDRFVSLKTHSMPRDEKVPSKRGEIYKNIALILLQKNQVEEAKAAFVEAKQANPDDVSLMISEADLYVKLKDYDTYTKLVNQILQKNPKDAVLVYNLGVISLEANQLAEAEKHLTRAIELDPKMGNAYLNLAAIKLKPDEALVKEMNALGTSAKENKRYDELKKQRTAMFQSAMPILEKAHEIEPANQDVIANLMSVYNFLEMTDKYKALKAKRQQ